MSRDFGTPSGVHVGEFFDDRRDLRRAGVHMPPQSGISGTAREGADSIVVSGGYVDDEDHGDYLIYTGHGGRDPISGRQIADQSMDAPGNAGLVTSEIEGYPVRVTRGSDRRNPFAPNSGYVYAGIFLVTSHWLQIGRDGFLVARFRLDRIPEQPPLVTSAPLEIDPAFSTTTVSRRVRDSKVSREIKALYNDCCQVCGTYIIGLGARRYSEGAHVRPLGRPHLGPDAASNLLCLCPNHQVQLDIGGLFITDDLNVVETHKDTVELPIRFAGSHRLDLENVKYHRALWTGAIR